MKPLLAYLATAAVVAFLILAFTLALPVAAIAWAVEEMQAGRKQ